jgi:RNA polymerase sigma-70 factor (ECF subfamily)
MAATGFDALVIAHQQTVLRTASRLLGRGEDARDATQEVFLRLLRSQSEVRRDLSAWLYRVTINICNDHFRRRRPTRELLAQTADPAPGPEHLMRVKQREQLFRQGLKVLTKRERAALVLREIQGYSAAEIGAMLEIKEATVRGHVYRARIKLAVFIKARSSHARL